MTVKIFCSILLFLPLAAMSQSAPDWTLYLNKTKLFSASFDSTVSIYLSKKDTGMLTLNFLQHDTAFKRSVIIMNEQRNTLLQKEANKYGIKASFGIKNLLLRTSAKPFTIYISDIPSDPAEAASVRIAPVAICRVVWR